MSGKKKLNAATFVITSVVEKEKLRGEKNNGPTRLNVSRPLPLAEKIATRFSFVSFGAIDDYELMYSETSIFQML